MSNATFPVTIFTTQRHFNDYSSDDMRYGDISQERLKEEFGLVNVSNVVDPYTLTRITAFNNPQSRFAGAHGGLQQSSKLSIQQCAQLLFEELQVTSLLYSFIGPHKYLINLMLKHFQLSQGSNFNHHQLNTAYRDKLYSNYATRQTRSVLYDNIGLYIDYKSKGLPRYRLKNITSAIQDSILPKFDSLLLDKINGMGITVHDIYATKIEILRLDVTAHNWRASIKFTAQDHFGLDISDISKKKFKQFQFFKIWFILQRYNVFGFKPFLTNMEAIIDIGGNR